METGGEGMSAPRYRLTIVTQGTAVTRKDLEALIAHCRSRWHADTILSAEIVRARERKERT
jgi:hypothetical protein